MDDAEILVSIAEQMARHNIKKKLLELSCSEKDAMITTERHEKGESPQWFEQMDAMCDALEALYQLGYRLRTVKKKPCGPKPSARWRSLQPGQTISYDTKSGANHACTQMRKLGWAARYRTVADKFIVFRIG